MAKKGMTKAPSRAQGAPDAKGPQGDVVGALAKIMCDYPDWPAEDLAALHLFKHEVLSSAYRLYLNVSPKRAASAITDILGKMSRAAN